MTLLGNFVRTSCREPLLQASQGGEGTWASRWRWQARSLAHQQGIQTHQIDGSGNAGHLHLRLLQATIAAAAQAMATHTVGEGWLHPRTRRIRLLKGWTPLLAWALLQGLMHRTGRKGHCSSPLLALGAQGFGLTALTELGGKAHLDRLLAAAACVGLPRLRELSLGTARLLLLPIQFKGAQSIAAVLLPTGIEEHRTQQLGALVPLVHDQFATEIATIQQHGFWCQLPLAQARQQRGGLFHILGGGWCRVHLYDQMHLLLLLTRLGEMHLIPQPLRLTFATLARLLVIRGDHALLIADQRPIPPLDSPLDPLEVLLPHLP